ncbi:DUF3108 domain-containing protein [Maricaulis sp. D1M11]|uniref:DUF3108 domain-containing protein n=1 Tax=Maricaulis sp. D1M11 TaxID=3076117 RepID=UPI0039B38E8A
MSKKALGLSTTLSAALIGLAISTPTGADTDEAAIAQTAAPLTVNVSYAGSVMIFQVADISVSSQFHDDTYQAAARLTTAGIAALFSDADIEAGVSGYRTGPTLQPYRYSHLNHASNKGRIVGIDFPDGVAVPDVNPPFGSMGEPPATDEERQGATDPLTALLSAGLGAVAGQDHPCEGRLPVFDGKARYNLRFEDGGYDSIRTRGWRGEAVVCRIYYEPISGYDEDEYPSDSDVAEPIVMWLAPLAEGEIHVPVKIRANSGFGGITVTARHLSVN